MWVTQLWTVREEKWVRQTKVKTGLNRGLGGLLEVQGLILVKVRDWNLLEVKGLLKFWVLSLLKVQDWSFLGVLPSLDYISVKRIILPLQEWWG